MSRRQIEIVLLVIVLVILVALCLWAIDSHAQSTSLRAVPFGGYDTFSVISANSDNSTLVKGSAGSVVGWSIVNTNASTRWLKLYDKATAPVCGTDTPKLRIGILATTLPQPVMFGTTGIAFTKGIGICLVTGQADSDDTSVGANDLTVNLFFK